MAEEQDVMEVNLAERAGVQTEEQKASLQVLSKVL